MSEASHEWNLVHRLIMQWLNEGDAFAGEMVLDWIRGGELSVRVTPEGLLIERGPKWPIPRFNYLPLEED